jgi:signal peptidase I
MSHLLNDSSFFIAVSTELLRSSLGLRFRAYGSSMHPTIRSDELITVVPIKPHEIKRGNIILFRTQFGSVMAHRVIGINQLATGLQFITRGDAATDCDRPVGAEQVLGRVISVERNGTQRKLTGLKSRLRQATRLRASQLKRYLPSRVRMTVGRFRKTLRRGQ